MSDEIRNKELEAKSEIYSRCGNATLNIPKILIRNLGLITAAFLESLITKEKYFFEHKMLTDDGYFWNLEEDRQDDCGLSPYQQNQAIILLKDLKILEVERLGMPARQYFRISYQNFKDLLLKFQGLDLKNLRTIYYKNNNDNNNNSNSISKDIVKDLKNPDKISYYIQTTSRRTKTKTKYVQNPDNVSEIIKNKPPKEPKISKNYILKDNWKYQVLEEWYKIPQVTKHRTNTKVAYDIARYLEYLKNGIFFNQCKVKQDYLKWNNIPLEWVQKNKSFSQREIMNAIKDFAKDFIDGYKPENKQIVPTDFSTFLFNKRTGSSWFLKCVANPDPKPIAEERKNTDPNPQYTKPFQEKKLLRFFEEKKYPSIYQAIRRIEKQIIDNKIFDFSLPNPDRCRLVGQGKGQLEPMFRNYAQYLNDTYNEIHEPDKIFYFYGYFKDYLEDLASRFRWVNMKNF